MYVFSVLFAVLHESNCVLRYEFAVGFFLGDFFDCAIWFGDSLHCYWWIHLSSNGWWGDLLPALTLYTSHPALIIKQLTSTYLAKTRSHFHHKNKTDRRGDLCSLRMHSEATLSCSTDQRSSLRACRRRSSVSYPSLR